MRVHVLGSAAGGGFPQWNCNCANCDGLRRGRIRARARTQSSIAVRGEAPVWALVNASPDILAQLRAFPEMQPGRAVRDIALGAIVLVDSQIDHTTGLLMLREGAPLPVYCTPSVHEDLTSANPLFGVLAHYCGIDWQPIEPDGERVFRLPGLPELAFRAIDLGGKAPPYSPARERPRRGDTIGLLIADELAGRTLFYAPALGAVDARLEALFDAVDCLLVDGTFWSDDEMIRAGVSAHRARDLGHLAQSGPGGMLEVLSRQRHPRKILIHVNNTNPILDEGSPQRALLVACGIEVACDGMEIVP